MPRTQRLSALSLSLLFATVTSITIAQEASITQCKSWRDEIARYDELRKNGGNAAQMNEWNNQRRIYQSKFDENHCRKYGKEVR